MGIISSILDAIFSSPNKPAAQRQQQPKGPHVIASFHSKVVGVTHRNDDGSDRQKIISRCSVGEPLELRHMPIAQHRNAVAVYRQTGKQLGWLSRELAEEIAPRLDKKGRIDVEVSGVTGGGLGKSRGCNIYINKYSLR